MRSKLASVPKGRFAFLLLIAFLSTAGIALAFSQSAPTLWIDEPLDGSAVEIASSTLVVGHVSNASGIEMARLDIDGIEVARSDVSTGPGVLATVQFDWIPDRPGTSVLSLWAKPVGGDWVGPAVATVSVIGDVATTTTAPTTTPTTVPTTTPTTVPTTTCTFGVPQLVSPAENAVIETTGVAIAVTHTWSYGGCSPSDLKFEIQVHNDPDFSAPILSHTVAGTTWESPPIACADYWWRVRVISPITGDWSSVGSYIVQGTCS